MAPAVEWSDSHPGHSHIRYRVTEMAPAGTLRALVEGISSRSWIVSTYGDRNEVSRAEKHFLCFHYSSTALSTNTLVTLGGRNDRPVELVSWSRSTGRRPSTDWPGELVFPQGRCPLVSSLIHEIRSNKLSTAKPSSSNQSCSRGHAAIPGDGGVLVSGGDGFNALVRDPLDTAYAFVYNDAEKKGVLYNCSRGHAAIPGDGGVLVSGGDGFNALVRDPLDTAYAFVYNDAEKKGVLYKPWIFGKLHQKLPEMKEPQERLPAASLIYRGWLCSHSKDLALEVHLKLINQSSALSTQDLRLFTKL
ncbi:hypothetical protein T265_11138 [Opisthorchis viverrini]|uniref:Uncharacterized protein n=1 Tax=Opisthorchis viverrini TaxID=6198 RepID=A0A074ZYM5_OPIVI|nr:hypothetical protein T265_11138 [Opisthorchis viverrini]KER20274.1 hypothetical protein T265_11138 [Opisthorchis viverrini]